MVSEGHRQYYLKPLSRVLILVIAVDGLGVEELKRDYRKQLLSLNPCYSGRWSRRKINQGIKVNYKTVLILVIAVDGLGDSNKTSCSHTQI